jgi:hypothetical protein
VSVAFDEPIIQHAAVVAHESDRPMRSAANQDGELVDQVIGLVPMQTG